MNDKELMKKSETCTFNEDNDLMTTCKAVVANVESHKKDLKLTEEETETYLNMTGNMKSEDISKILSLALKIRESSDIKDPEKKVEASKLIRAIEIS
jgi:hypothetical protein